MLRMNLKIGIALAALVASVIALCLVPDNVWSLNGLFAFSVPYVSVGLILGIMEETL